MEGVFEWYEWGVGLLVLIVPLFVYISKKTKNTVDDKIAEGAQKLVDVLPKKAR